MTALLLSLLVVLPEPALDSSDGVKRALPEVVKAHRYTVVVFFSEHCPVQKAHDAVLKELATRLEARDVAFLLADSEGDSTLQIDRAEATKRGYPFPIVSDPDGLWARALGARFTTYTVVLDPQGQVRYRGGIDSAGMGPRDEVQRYLEDALEQLFDGKSPKTTDTKARGCVLRLK